MVIRNQCLNRDKYGFRASHVWLAQYQKLSTTSVLEQIISKLFAYSVLTKNGLSLKRLCSTEFAVFPF